MSNEVTSEDIEKLMKNITIEDLLRNNNKIIDNEILEGLNKFSGNDETKTIIESVIKSYSIFIEMINEEYFIEAFAILRSIFEEILMGIAIEDNQEIYQIYIKIEQNKKERNNIQPCNIRRKASTIFDAITKEEHWHSDFNNYYTTLCLFVHPTILRNYFYGISNSKYEKENIKIVIKNSGLYCKYLLLIYLKYKQGEKKIQKYYDLYIANQLMEIATMKEKNDIDKVLTENEKYLHLEINKDTIMNDNSINELINNSNTFNFSKFKEVVEFLYIEKYIKCFKNK